MKTSKTATKTASMTSKGNATKIKPKFYEKYNDDGNLGYFLRHLVECYPDAELGEILIDVMDWPQILEAMIADHGDDAKVSDFDLS